MIVWWISCASPVPDSDTDPTGTEDTHETQETDIDTDLPIVDVDADGYKSDIDCDDYDPAIRPGASEKWNSIDDNCDGVIDADGAYAGNTSIDTTAIFEGKPYSWRLSCPTTLVRRDRSFTLAVTCTSDPDDARMVQLLGDVMMVNEIDNIASEDHFAGAMRVSSTSGWDANGTATLTWVDFTKTDLSFSLNTTSLDLSGRARLVR